MNPKEKIKKFSQELKKLGGDLGFRVISSYLMGFLLYRGDDIVFLDIIDLKRNKVKVYLSWSSQLYLSNSDTEVDALDFERKILKTQAEEILKNIK